MDFSAVNKLVGITDNEKPVEAKVTVNSLDDFCKLFVSGMGDAERAEFSKNLPRGDEDTDFLQEAAGHVFGNQALESDAAREFVKNAFPVSARILTGKDVVISTDIIVGPRAPPYLVNADTLTFDGGSITVIATVLTVRANTLRVLGSKSSNKPYHIGILGQKGMTGEVGENGRPYSAPAQSGKTGYPTTPGNCTGSGTGGNGHKGNTGSSGGLGGKGRRGHPNLPANITIKNFDANSNTFVLFTKSGPGGTGGNGGNGGNGQDGGSGGAGCWSGCTGSHGGNGGNGGNSGNGGNGGPGEDGANGNPIHVTFPEDAKALLSTVTEAAMPGVGGEAGHGGDGGRGGAGGGGGKHSYAGTAGETGIRGKPGKKGADGKHSGAPGNITIKYLST